MIVAGRCYETGQSIELTLRDGRIAAVKRSAASVAALPWIAPGFVDLQINGYGGKEFNDSALTPDDVEKISLSQDACGVVAYCPTITTHSFDVQLNAMRTIAAACEKSRAVADRVLGIHLEGPYISVEDGPRGAHPRQHVRPPNWDEFQRYQEGAKGRIRIVTLSPEYDDAPEFIRRASDSGVVVAIGHTSADSRQIQAAVDAGARFSTHLGNGAHPRIRRHPNYIWDQLADDRLFASLIVDGHHLPPSVVKSFVRGKTPGRCLLVSDITGMAGMPPGRYEKTTLGAVEILDDGKMVVAGQRDLLAGAALPMGVGVANVMRFADVSLGVAIKMASIMPAQLVQHPVTRLEVGAPANLVLFDLPIDDHGRAAGQLSVRATILKGQIVYGRVNEHG